MISLTELGKRIVAPTTEGDDLAAKREAALRPRIVRQFLSKYDGSPFPKEDIARNVLEEMGIARGATERVAKLIFDSAKELGLIREIKGKYFVRLVSPAALPDPEPHDGELDDPHADADEKIEDVTDNGEGPKGDASPPKNLTRVKRVFITHGSNGDIVKQLKELLVYGGLEPVVSVEKETVAKPVPDKVLDDMRSCGAAIVHVGSELKLIDQDGHEHRVVNPNVLIEIGAAMALFGRRFILLVERGVTLPSNLQGLYEVRYEGLKLDYDATLKLLKAFNEFRS